MDDQNFTKKAKKQLTEWNEFADELHEQLDIGIHEAAEEFEKQKEKLNQCLEDYIEQLRYAQNVSTGSMKNVISSLEDLQKKASISQAIVKEKIDEQQSKLSQGIAELKDKISNAKEVVEDEAEHILEEVGDKLEGFHTRIDLLRLQFHLGRAEVKDEWKEKKRELAEKIAEIKSKLEQAEDDAEKSWDDFSTEIRGAWSHLKKAFKGK